MNRSNKCIFTPCPFWEYVLDWKWALGSILDRVWMWKWLFFQWPSQMSSDFKDGRRKHKLPLTTSYSTFSPPFVLLSDCILFLASYPPSLHVQSPLILVKASPFCPSPMACFYFSFLTLVFSLKKKEEAKNNHFLSWHVFLLLLPFESPYFLLFQGSQTHLLQGNEWKCPSFQTFVW